MNIFSAYGVVKEVFKASKLSFLIVYTCSVAFLFHHSLLALAVYAGSNVTKEAAATVAVHSRVMHGERSQNIDFVHFDAQIRSRNLNIQNFLFKINWHVFLTVRNILMFNQILI